MAADKNKEKCKYNICTRSRKLDFENKSPKEKKVRKIDLKDKPSIDEKVNTLFTFYLICWY